MLSKLELKLPPPLVGLVLAMAMWALAQHTPRLALPAAWRWGLALALLLPGLALELGALRAFVRARTTIHPLRPERSSALVTAGFYRFSRNPMYLGMLLLLCAWAVWLAAPLALLGPAAFVAWINRFQIRPEERVLRAHFGPAFDDYRSRVRRWL